MCLALNLVLSALYFDSIETVPFAATGAPDEKFKMQSTNYKAPVQSTNYH